jgi:AraC family transcriptional regulator of adaptative response/methylated-DNA-[protein]-cysteine methyltransferase
VTRRIGWTVVTTSLGPLLVAASERGVCRVAFGEGEAELAALLARELPFASLERDGAGVGAFADALARYVDGRAGDLALPLDVAGSRFQQRVWDALRAIPRGEVRSYGAVARALGEPTAARAVARACATNPVAVAIPCHRVVASDGSLGGYHYGVARKRRLLVREGAPVGDPPGPTPRDDFRGRAEPAAV